MPDLTPAAKPVTTPERRAAEAIRKIAPFDAAEAARQWAHNDLQPSEHTLDIDATERIIAAAIAESTAVLQARMAELADAERIRDWWNSGNPKPPELAFTAGPEREIADLLWSMRMALDRIYNHNEAARAAVIQHYG